MQLQADLSGRVVRRSTGQHLSAYGAALAAGLGCGLWSEDDLAGLTPAYDTFAPRIDADTRAGLLAGWHEAVERSRHRAGRPADADRPEAPAEELSSG